MTKNCDNCFYHERGLTDAPCKTCSGADNWIPRTTKPEEPSQTAKADAGKPDLTLVPRQIIWDIAAVRAFGNAKYGSPDNWKTVEPQRYRAAAFRHFLAYLDDPKGVDAESGLPHLWHLCTNCAFLCEMEKENEH